jgi:membrane fusion protein (multidrug efflux system)
MKTKHIVYSLIVVLLGAAIVYRIVKNKNAAGTGPGKGGPGAGMPPAKVNGMIVGAQEFTDQLSISGSIEAYEQVQIHPEVSGVVKDIYFQEGSNVSNGQLLLKINDTELQAQLKQALSKEQLAAETESRAKQLLKKEAISQEEYDVAFAELRSLKAQTELIRAQLAKTAIRAPFSGRIGLRSISAGEYVTPNTAIAKLVNSSQVKISFSVPEKYAGQMQKNTSISFSVAGSTKTYQAKIYAIEPGIEINTRTLQLKALANNPGAELLPGSFAKINLPLASIKDAILIPSQSIIPVLKGKMVFISDSGKAKQVMVETGPRTDKNVLVVSGLRVGDTLLTSGMMSLKPETPVKVKLKQ